jgi:AbrB family looped-hinge helix DNA binding protein
MLDLDTHRMQEIVKNLTTVSDKIRALDLAGFARADIARFLEKRYSHVRNVLEAESPRRNIGMAEASHPGSLFEPHPQCVSKSRIQIGAGGRIVIPAEMRATMGVGEGDLLSARIVDDELRLLSQDAAIRRAQALVRQYIPAGVNLVDELIEERRLEAGREDGE